MAGLTIDGFTSKTLTEIDTEMTDEIHQGISPTLNLSSTSALGQLKSTTASHVSEVWDAALALWASWDIDQATDAALDRLAALTGTRRRAATPSRAYMTITLEAGTYGAHVLVVNPVGDPNTRFDNDLEITVGSTTTLVDQLFSCQETGPVNVPAAQLTVITTPVTGFSAPANPAAVVPGTNVETNFEFRQRRELELALKGSSTVDAIRADLLQTVDANGDPLFTFVAVLENDTDATVDGVPPHAFETLVIGGTSAEVATAIYLAKPAGIQAFGDDSDVVLDSQNNPHTIGFTRPDDVEVNIGVVVSAIAGQFPGDVAVREAVVDYFEQNQSVGWDVIHAQYVRIVMDLPGVVDVAVTIAGNADPFTGAATNFAIASREIARLGDDAPDGVGVTVVTVAGVP